MLALGFGAVVWTVITCVLTWVFWKKRPAYSPPGTNGLPFLGELLSFGKYKESIFSKLNEKYGPICMIKLGFKDAVIINSPEISYEAFAKNDCFNDRLQSIPMLTGGKGILLLNRKNFHKEQRRFGLNTLREFGMGRRSLEPHLLELTHELCNKIDDLCGKEGTSSSFDMAPYFYELTSNVISSIIFGHSIGPQNEDLQNVISELKVEPEANLLDGILFLAPSFRYMPVFSSRWNVGVKRQENIHRAIRQEIQAHIETRDPEVPRDFVDCFLNQIDKREEIQITYGGKGQHHFDPIINKPSEQMTWKPMSSFSEDQLVAVVRDLFLAGIDTTTNVLLWIILFLCKNPEAQKKMHSEIDNVIGKNGFPNTSKMNEVPYVRAVIQEVTRLKPVTPLILHVTGSDGILSGYKIKKGTLIIVNLMEIHTSEKKWTDSEKFLPERHINSEGKFCKSSNWMAFGVGSRSCLGQQLAQMELFITTISLLQRFEFSIPQDCFPDMNGDKSISLRPFAFNVTVTRR